MGVCLVLFISAVITYIAVDDQNVCVLISVAGVTLSFIAIILAMFSKPKKLKPPPEYDPIIQTKTIESSQPVTAEGESGADLS